MQSYSEHLNDQIAPFFRLRQLQSSEIDSIQLQIFQYVTPDL